jgi:hypothetical protein
VDVRRILHVVRPGAAPIVADADWVVYEEGLAWRLDPHGAPPFPAGSIDDAQLLDLLFAADAVVTW